MKSKSQTTKSKQTPKPKNQTGKPYDLRERTFLFALDVLELCSKLPRAPETNAVREQLSRAGTSVGANVEEADGALTKKDKRKSFVVSRKEAGEARYWLRIINARWGAYVDAAPLVQEAFELMNIISTIIRKLG